MVDPCCNITYKQNGDEERYNLEKCIWRQKKAAESCLEILLLLCDVSHSWVILVTKQVSDGGSQHNNSPLQDWICFITPLLWNRLFLEQYHLLLCAGEKNLIQVWGGTAVPSRLFVTLLGMFTFLILLCFKVFPHLTGFIQFSKLWEAWEMAFGAKALESFGKMAFWPKALESFGKMAFLVKLSLPNPTRSMDNNNKKIQNFFN